RYDREKNASFVRCSKCERAFIIRLWNCAYCRFRHPCYGGKYHYAEYKACRKHRRAADAENVPDCRNYHVQPEESVNYGRYACEKVNTRFEYPVKPLRAK